MKKAAVLLFVFLFFAGITFAQEPQKPVKKEEATKTEQTSKAKADCAEKTSCSKVKSKSACCAHGKAAAKPSKEDPGKK